MEKYMEDCGKVVKEGTIRTGVGQCINVYLEDRGKTVNDVFIVLNENEDKLNAEKIDLIEEKVSKYIKDQRLTKAQLEEKIEDELIDDFPWGVEVIVK